MNPEHYCTTHAKRYKEQPPIGYLSAAVLPCLIGHKWDNVALGYVHSLRPSAIRVTTGEQTCDAYLWRVTVTVGEDNKITSVEQEVEVGLPEGVRHGYDLQQRLEAGKES